MGANAGDAAGCTGAPGSAGEGFSVNVAVDGSWVGDAEVGAVVGADAK